MSSTETTTTTTPATTDSVTDAQTAVGLTPAGPRPGTVAKVNVPTPPATSTPDHKIIAAAGGTSATGENVKTKRTNRKPATPAASKSKPAAAKPAANTALAASAVKTTKTPATPAGPSQREVAKVVGSELIKVAGSLVATWDTKTAARVKRETGIEISQETARNLITVLMNYVPSGVWSDAFGPFPGLGGRKQPAGMIESTPAVKPAKPAAGK